MKPTAESGPDEFAAILRAQPGEWSRAKAEAFDRLVEAFPDPDGPPDWGLRQILRGQFDRRIPEAWRPVFVEVYHQWLGFRAEAAAARDDRAGTWTWWLRSLVPALRPHGWAGLPFSPAAVVLVLLIFAGLGFVRAAERRAWSIREVDATSALLQQDAWGRSRVEDALADGSTDALVGAMAEIERLREQDRRAELARPGLLERLDAAKESAACVWTWPWSSLSGR